MSFSMQVFSVGRKIKKQWKLSLLVVLFLPLLLHLGFWQLERAEEKRQLLSVYQDQQTLPAIPFDKTLDRIGDINYRTVIINGQYDPSRYWLLDNKPRSGRVGYEVVMPLKTNNIWVLINRGWVEAPLHRDQLPLINTSTDAIKITGYFYSPSKNAVIDSGRSDRLEQWPQRVLHIDMKEVKELLGIAQQSALYPQVLRIDAESPSALITDWPMVNTLPEKHQGYAVQWFAMSLVLLLLYLWALFKKYD